MAQVAQVAQVQRARDSSRYLRKTLESMNLHDMAKHPKIRGPLPKECRHHLHQAVVSADYPGAWQCTCGKWYRPEAKAKAGAIMEQRRRRNSWGGSSPVAGRA